MLVDVLEHRHDTLDARDQVHGPAHALQHLAGDGPVGDVAVGGHFHGAQNGQVDVPSPNHGEAVRRAEEAGRRQFGDRLLAGVDQVRIDFVRIGKRPHAQHAVLGLQGDVDPFGNMVGHQRRNADAEIDVEAVLKLARGAGGHLVAGPAGLGLGHYEASLSRVVSFSMRFSLMVESTMRSTKMPGVCT
ncbi:hypothetical protein D3C80_1273310 [compost metagenome]